MMLADGNDKGQLVANSVSARLANSVIAQLVAPVRA